MNTNSFRTFTFVDDSHRIFCSRFLSIAFMAIWIFLATTLLALGQEADSPDLPKSIARKLQKNVMPPLQAGNHGEFQSQLANIICKLKPESFEQIEAYGQANDFGSLSKAFYTAWRNEVRRGNASSDLKMKRPVALYLTSGTTEELDRLLVELQDHDVMNATEPPKNWLESRNLFLDAESFKDRMPELRMMGQFANAALQPHRVSAKLHQGEAGEILERFQSTAESFAKVEKQIIEKEAVLRLQRLNASAQALREPGDFEKRFVSALFLEEDASALEDFFSTSSDPEADELNEPGLAQTTINTISHARNSGNPIVEKARLLSKGLQAWKRGRYGIGDLFSGLLKSSLIPNPNNSRTTSSVLRMPETTLAISQFLESDSGPGFDRRHYYTWDLEYRPLYSSYSDSSGDSTRRDNYSYSPETSEQLVCSNGQPYTRHTRDVEYDETRTQVESTRLHRDWAPQDDSIPPRIVGTQEYSAAITYLEKLVGMSSAEEIEVYDKVIALLPEFVFYSGMTSGVKQPKPSNGGKVIMNMEDAKPQDVVSSQFKKQSLAWLMALAKVELNATRSMYIPGDDAFKPIASSKFGLPEYYHVLLDDVAAHLNAIETDDQFKKAIKTSLKEASSETVAYLRRLKLVSSMLIALEHSGDPMIGQKSAEYRKTIDRYNLRLLKQAEVSSKDIVQTNRKVSTERRQGRTGRIETH